MSTKCQYQAAISNPRIRNVFDLIFVMRYSVNIRKVVPIMTWSPWNPVATKNVLP